MPTTTNFGWTTPADTDLVKDGASAIRTLGNGIDTSLVDLKGGTTGQVLSKASNTDMDFTWTNGGDITEVTAGTGISGGGTSGAVTITNSMATAIDAKGDLIAGTGADTFSRLAVGTNGQYLSADSTASTGLKWVTAASSALVLVKRATFTNVANTGTTFDGVFTSTYGSYLVIIESLDAATLSNDPQMQLRSGGTTKTNNYYSANLSYASDATTASSLTTSSNTLWTLSPNALITGQLFFNGSNVMGHTIDAMGPSFNIIQGFVDSYGPDGFLLKSSSSNINGTVSVYGLAKS